MKEIMHQFSNKDFYVPNWKIKYLFIGTFNPEGGEKVNYYYGRETNKTWAILSEIFKEQFNPNDEDFLIKLEEYGIACIDLIHSVKAPNERIDKITGKGYADSKIINKSVSRIYNTEIINNIISKNPDLKIFSTWGKGSNLKDWKNQVKEINNIVTLVSPSMAARVKKGTQKYPFMLNDWKNQIF